MWPFSGIGPPYAAAATPHNQRHSSNKRESQIKNLKHNHDVRNGLRAADVVVGPTRSILDAIARHYGPFRRTDVIHNGRDPALFRPGRKEEFVFTAGRIWDMAKNVAAIDAAAPAIAWPVIAAGDTTHPEGGHCPMQNVRLLGVISIDEIARWLSRASIYALPARYEPFGLTVLEAAHAGCALVLGDIDSLRELWDDAALFVPPDNHEALARSIQMLIDDAPLRRMLAENARRRAAAFTPDAMAERYINAYTHLLRRLGATQQASG